jgi:hypothetical protein
MLEHGRTREGEAPLGRGGAAAAADRAPRGAEGDEERDPLSPSAGGAGLGRWQQRASDRPAGGRGRGQRAPGDRPVQRAGDEGAGPSLGGCRPRRISAEDEAFLVATATTRPGKLGRPFTHWSLRKLVAYLADNPRRIVRIGRERARQLLAAHEITFQRTTTWKESPDPQREAKLGLHRDGSRATSRPDLRLRRVRPTDLRADSRRRLGTAGAPARLPANYHKLAGVRYFHGCYAVAEDRLCGVVHEHKDAANTLAALRSIRAARPDDQPIHVIVDNLSAHKGPTIRAWAARHQVQLCFTPTHASWANPIAAHFGPLRSFVLAGSAHPNHVVLTRALHAHLRWRTRTPVTPTCSPPNAANGPASAASATAAGDTPRTAVG